VSLVLDALKKLERDKERREPGVLVVGALPWQGVRRRRAPFLALAIAAPLLLALALGVWLLGRPARVVPSEVKAPARATEPEVPAANPAPGSRSAPMPPAPAERRLTLPERAALPAAPARPALASPSRRDPQLNAISLQEGRPVAVIDGHLVREGESVGSVRVLRIGQTEVEVEVQGVRRTLRF